MDTLPRKVLKRILEMIPDYNLAPLKEVCQTWHDIIDLELGIPQFLGNGNESYWVGDMTWSPLKTISEVGISRAFFSEIQEDIPSSGFKCPHLVTEISFDGFVSESAFSKLIGQLPHLRIIKIHTSTLCYLRSAYLREWNLPHLRDLHIVSYGTDIEESWAHMNDHILDNTDIILRSNRFPKLRHLILNMLFVPTRENDLTNAILECLATHKGTLRSLGMEYKYAGDSNDMELSVDPMESSKWLLKLRGLQLDKFSLQFYYDGGPKSGFWKEFLTSQHGLTRVDYICGNGLIPFPTALVLQNQSTLVQIHLKVHVVDPEFDSSVFSGCVNLKTLGIINKSSEIAFEIPRSECPIFTNPQSLPSSIQSLLIGSFNLRSYDAQFIAFEMPNLGALCFSMIGSTGEFGLELMDLMRILEERKLERITIVEGLNERSMKDPGTQDPVVNMCRRLLYTLDSNLDCYLSSDGIFDATDIYDIE